MRLIDTKTLALKEFFGYQIPPYAILSHTWHEEEVSFQEWANQSTASQKKGYKKILDTCHLAKNHGHNYLWVDTNCIDKSSSAELSEAINSMFKWYKLAQVCYVYLLDVPSSEAVDFTNRFRASRWFKRGWTLQELLAPRDVEFYSCDWKLLGTKESLCSEISTITGINAQYMWRKHMGTSYIGASRDVVAQGIEYIVPLRRASVSERFSWLSRRESTRQEDMAYCMLGIFELSMPLLYGEGSKAFIRLQEEILKISDDHSLFCWTWKAPQNRGGFLSEAPSEFEDAGRFFPKRNDQIPVPYTFGNAGLNIQLPVIKGFDESFLCVLRVGRFGSSKVLGLPMSGNLKTGCAYRKPFPPEPIPLCDNPASQESFGRPLNLFISENYDYKQQNSAPLIEKNVVPARNKYASFTVLLTMDPKLEPTVSIITYPANRFDDEGGFISIFQQYTYEDSCFLLVDDEHTYEAVLVQLETSERGLKSFKSFMIAVRHDFRALVEWKPHYWRIPTRIASQILSGKLDENSPLVKQIHMAIKDPEYARRVYSESGPGFSISMAEEYLLVDYRSRSPELYLVEEPSWQQQVYLSMKEPDQPQPDNPKLQARERIARQYSLENFKAVIHMHLHV